MEVLDTLAEGGGGDSEGGSAGRGTPATGAERRATGPTTARDEVTPHPADTHKSAFVCDECRL